LLADKLAISNYIPDVSFFGSQPKMMKIRFLPYIAALSTGMIVLASVWVLDRSETKRFQESNRADVLNQVSTVRAKLEGALNSRLFLARGLVAHVSSHPDIDQQDFQRIARVMISQQTGIGSIALYKNSIVTQIYPFKGHEAAIGFNPLSIPEEREAIERAISSRKTVVAGPVNLVEGGVGFINRTPIFLSPPDQPPESGPYWGLAGVIIDRDTIFREGGLIPPENSSETSANPSSFNSQLQFALRGKDGLGANGAVFFGDAAIFQQNPIILAVELPNGSWQVAAIPQGGWQREPPISRWLRPGGIILAVLVGFLVFIWVRSPEKLRIAVEEATAALRSSETKYRELVQNANSIILKVDPQGRITFFNEFAQKFFGYSESEILGQSVLGTILQNTDSYGDNLQTVIADILQNSEPDKQQENENIRRNGERVWISWRDQALFDEKGSFNGLLCIGSDITSRKQAEAKLKESEEKFRTLYESTSDAVMLLNETAFFDCNPATLEIFGCTSKDQLCGKNPAEFSPKFQPNGEDSVTLTTEKIQTALHTGSCRFEWLHRRLDGSEFPAEVWLTSMELGTESKIIQAVIRDITERKRAEEALRASQQMLRLVMDNIPQAIFWKDRNSVYQGCNIKFAEDVGLANPSEVIGKTDYDFCDSESQAKFLRRIDLQVIENNAPVTHYCEFLCFKNGREAWLETSKVPLHDAQGNVVGILVTYEDITERKRIEEALRESETKFRLLFEESGDAILLWQNHKFIDCNQAAVEMMGATDKHQLLNSHPSELSPEKQPDGSYSLVKSTQNNALALERGSLRFEWLHRRIDGSEFPVEVLLTAIPLQREKILHVVWRDITERKRAEASLKASERRLQIQSSALLELATNPKLTSGNFTAAVQEMTEVAARTLEVERVSIWLYNPEKTGITCLDLYETKQNKHSSGMELLVVDYPEYFQALQTERILAVHNVQTDDRTKELLASYLLPLGIISMLDTPIRLGGKMIGVICHEHTVTPRYWTLDEENFAASLADFVALAMEGAERRRAQEALERANEELELRVEERTSALREANHQLIVEIRERSAAEAALRTSEEKFSKAFHSSPDVMTITRLKDGVYVDVNETFLRLLGFTKEEVIGHNSIELNLWVNPQERLKLMRLIEEKQTVSNQEFQFRKKSGEIIAALLSAEIIKLNGESSLLVVCTDITELKKTEAALRQAEEKYRKIFENAVEGIFQTSPEGRYLSANPALAKLYGYSSPQELIDQIYNVEYQIYVDSNRRNECIKLMEDQNSVSGFESQVYRKDGSVIWVSENAHAVRDLQNNVLYYEGIVENITKRKIAEEALRYQQEQTERLLLNILPQPIAERLRREQTTIADSFTEATVLFADIVGFTELSANIPPVELVEMLNEIFSTFDYLTEDHGLEKIKTIGDAYMVVGGLPIPREDHAAAIAEMALDMRIELSRFNRETGLNVQLRVGINTGPVIAGVIGIKKFIYDLWGDTVNTASRMESHGVVGEIQVTTATYELLKGKYLFQERGNIQIKGKGEMTTYLLRGKAD